jgi:hypothetical protein
MLTSPIVTRPKSSNDSMLSEHLETEFPNLATQEKDTHSQSSSSGSFCIYDQNHDTLENGEITPSNESVICIKSPKEEEQAYVGSVSSSFIFFVEFSSGYSFRQLVEFACRVSPHEFPMVFTNKGIDIAIGNISRYNSIVVNINIRAEDLIKYHINIDHVNVKGTQDNWCHIVCVDTIELLNQIRSVAKRDTICLMQKANRQSNIRLQLSGPKTDGGSINIKSKSFVPVEYEIKQLKTAESLNPFPNATILLSKFSSCLIGLQKAKYHRILLHVYEQGVVILGATTTGSITRGSPFGIVPLDSMSLAKFTDNPNRSYFSVTLPNTAVNSLLKLVNFHNDGVIKLYCTNDNTIRFELNLSCYGAVQIFISDSITKKQLC